VGEIRFIALVATIGVGVAAVACQPAGEGEAPGEASPDTAAVSDTGAAAPATARVSEEYPYALLPVIDAWYEGEKVWFIHTEVSQEKMAARLTRMIDYPTVHAERLGRVDTANATAIYVFQNGVDRRDAEPWGGGPFHYQIDVLAAVPGGADYTPLHNPHLVSWRDTTAARVLKSEAEVLEAERNGEVTIERTPVIVNAPVVRWPGGPTGDPRRGSR